MLQKKEKKKKDFSSYLLPIPFDYLSRAMSSKGKSQQESHRHTSAIWGLTDFGVIQMAGFLKIFFQMKNYYNCPFPRSTYFSIPLSPLIKLAISSIFNTVHGIKK